MWLALTACGGGDGDPTVPKSPAEPAPPEVVPFLRTPIGGVLNRDVFYGSYVDGDSTRAGSRVDYQCLDKTVDGHTGTDVLVPTFREMDAGVPVLAAAAGTVRGVHDGEFDRNATLQSGRIPNALSIIHENGLATVYLHLRRGSVAVEAGDRVEAGDTIALVGSSGSSDWPHLHFAVHHVHSNGVLTLAALDPREGPCGRGASLWEDQLPYQSALRLVDAGLTTASDLDKAALLERPPTVDSVRAEEARLTFWAILHNPGSDAGDFEILRPDRESALSRRVALDPSPSLGITTVSFDVAGALAEPGEWTVRFRVGSEVSVEIPFRLVAAAPVAAGVRAGLPALSDMRIRVGGWAAGDGR